MDSFLLVDNVAFECARPAVAPLEVRFAHPVRLPPATHSQGHGRPCLQRPHPRRGFSATWPFQVDHFRLSFPVSFLGCQVS